MVDKTLAQKMGITPAKGFLILVLSIVLTVVLVMQFIGDEPVAKSNQAVARTSQKKAIGGGRANAKRKTVTAAAQSAREAKPWEPWTRVPVEKAVQFNPLKLPAELAGVPAGGDAIDAELAPPDEARTSRQLLEEAGVRAIVIGPEGRSAFIGNQLVREGDLIHGYRVQEIREDGVELVEP